MSATKSPLPGRERGATLLVLLAIIAVAVLALLLRVAGKLNQRTAHVAKSDRALAQARMGLLAWAATHPSLPGHLPCPENTALIGSASEGTALASCTRPALGRLPWRSLGLPRLVDGTGEPLWYAVSDGFGSVRINSATPAQLTVDGIAGSAVAIILAPGARVPGQVRPRASITAARDPIQYLEGSNSAAGNSYVSELATGNFNDKLLVLTQPELLRSVETRVEAEVALRLRAYYAVNHFFPYASVNGEGACLAGLLLSFVSQLPGNCSHPVFPGSLGGTLGTMPAWFSANEWGQHVEYRLASGCVELTPGTGSCVRRKQIQCRVLPWSRWRWS